MGQDKCQRGHLFTEENTIWRSDGKRRCRACLRERDRDKERKKRGQEPLRKSLSYEERFWAKVDVKGPYECWEWQGGTIKGNYGQFRLGGNKRVPAHRYAYEAEIGPIPEGLTIDHLCRNELCVNPAHLEPCSMGENVMRGTSFSSRNAKKTHCNYGHPLSGDNLYVYPDGRRYCRACVKRRYAE